MESIAQRLSISSKLVNKETGLIREITQWLPEYDDPRVAVVAALMSNTRQLGMPSVASTLNSGAAAETKDAALAAIGECIERFCAIPSGREDIMVCSAQDLQEAFITPKKFEFYSKAQYKDKIFHFSEFNANSKVGWVKVREVLNPTEELYAPAATIFLPYFPTRDSGEELIWRSVSSGLACAPSLKSAISSGVYEVVERDAFMLAWLLGLKASQIDISNDSYLCSFIEKTYGQTIRYVTLLDITSEFNIPTVLGVFHKPGEGLLVAAATRSTYVDAVKKTLLELAQGRITWRRDFEDAAKKQVLEISFDRIRTFDDHVRLFMSPSLLEKVSFLFEGEKVPIEEIEKSSAFAGENKFLSPSEILTRSGFDSYYYDLSYDYLARLGFYVSRVIVPGLLEISNDHVFPRLGNSRIETYYAALMGTKSFAYKPSRLNPVPHPFP